MQAGRGDWVTKIGRGGCAGDRHPQPGSRDRDQGSRWPQARPLTRRSSPCSSSSGWSTPAAGRRSAPGAGARCATTRGTGDREIRPAVVLDARRPQQSALSDA
jgi:hypothetical protein